MKNNKEEIEEIDNSESIEDLTDTDDDFGKKKIQKKVKVKQPDVNEDEDDEEYEELSMEDRIANIEKKVNTNLIVSVLTIILLVILLIVSISDGDEKERSTTNSTDSSQSSSSSQQSNTSTYSIDKFDEISASDISKESKGKPILIMIGRQGCGYCALYAPMLENLQTQYDFTTKYIDFSKIVKTEGGYSYIADEEAYKTLVNLTGTNYNGWVEENFGKTPMTIIVKDNKILYGGLGAQEDSTLIEQFNKVGISKK